MKTTLKRMTCLVLALVLVMSLLPAGALAAGVSSALVSSLAEVYDGDEARAREDLEALYAAGIIDADGNMAALDIKADGESADLTELAQRIADGEDVGAITVNGNPASPEQIVQISQVSAMLELQKLLSEDVEITDEHVSNLEALIEGIASGSVDLDRAIKTGMLSMHTQGVEDSGEVTVNGDGKYVQPLIDGATYEAEHAFELLDPTNKNYYVGSYGGVVADGVVSLSANKDAYNPGETVTVTATLNKAQQIPVSFDWSIGGNAVGVAESGTVTWGANDNELTKTFTATIPAKESGELWQGSRGLQISAGNIQNALFSGDATVWTKKVSVNASDDGAIKASYNKMSYDSVSNPDKFTITNCNSQVINETCYGVVYPWLEVFPFYIDVTASDQYGCVYLLDNSVTPAAFANNPDGFKSSSYQTAYANREMTVNSNGGIRFFDYFEEKWLTRGVLDNGYKYKNENKAHMLVVAGTLTKVTVWAYAPAVTNKVKQITVPAGTYYTGQVVPITVELENYVKVNADTKLTVNQVECTPLDAVNTETKKVTFGYTVKAVDTGALNITALSGLKNASGEAQSLSSAFTGQSIGANEDVHLESTAVKSSSIDWTNAKYGISDEVPGQQLITVVMPLGTKPTWVVSEAVKYNTGNPITVDLPGYSGAVADWYLPSAYLSCDGGKTRYPVYVAEFGSTAVLFGCISPFENETIDLRKDTVNLFMAPEILSAENQADVTKYLPAWNEDIQFGDPIDSNSEKPGAAIVLGKSWTVYVKGGVYFEKDEHIDNRDTTGYEMDGTALKVYENRGDSFLKKTDGNYVLLQDPEHPEYQFDVEVVVNQDFFDALANGVRMEAGADPQITLQFSNRKNFTFKDPTDFTWSCSNEKVAVMTPDAENGLIQHVSFIGPDDGEVTFSVVVGNGTESRAYELNASKLFALAGKDPFLNIPTYSQVISTLTGTDTDVLFASNVTARNAAVEKETTFTAELYKAVENGDTYEKTGEALWTGSFESTTEETVTHITVPAAQLTSAGIYAVVISTRYEGGAAVEGVETAAQDFSATAYLDVKQAPVKVTLNELESYSVTNDAIPTIAYTVNSADATVEYTVQKSGESVGERQAASGGTIPFSPATPAGLKDAYVITVYAQNPGDEAWSVDSMLLTVYNKDALDIIVADVAAGEIGGTTGGSGEGVNGKTVAMDNHSKLTENYGVTAGSYQLTFDDFQTLRTDMSLQKIISANYGSGVWGLLSDKMQWSSSDSDVVSVDYEQGGIYSDINNYSYTSYGPATDFLLVGKGDTEEGKPVTITATHANTGMEASFDVTTNRLDNELYLFQFVPKVETTVIYTNGNGDERKLTTNDQGELAVYEPTGFETDGVLMAKSEKGGVTYIGTLRNNDMVSGERDIGALQLYPCNNFKLRPVADANLTILNPDGTPYSGQITIRAGVYRNGVYCPDAKVRLEGETVANRNGREDINTTVANGKLKVGFDVSQFNRAGMSETDGMQPGDKVSYVIEYRLADGSAFRPGYVRLDVTGDLKGEIDPKDSVIQLYAVSGTKDQPQISRQIMQQYLDGTTATGYTRDVTAYTDNIGISPRFSKTVVDTIVALPGETVEADGDGFSTYTSTFDFSVALYTAGTDGKKLTGQTRTGVEKDTAAKQIVNLGDLDTEEVGLFVFPFSSVPMLRSTYTMTDENLTADGITDTGKNPNPTVRVKAHFTRDDLTIRTETMPYGVSNLKHQKDLSQSGGGAAEIAGEVKGDLAKQMDIGGVFKSVGVNEMLQKGFAFLSKLRGSGDQPLNMIILPTQDPAVFRIVILIGGMLHDEESTEGLSINYDSDKLAEDANEFEEELEKLTQFKADDEPQKDNDNDDDDDDDDDEGEGEIDFRFSGALYLTAKCDIANKDWDISFTGGKVGTSIKASYTWSQNFMCGPVPFFVEFEASAGAKVQISFVSKDDVRAMLLDTALSVSLRAFAGLGLDLSLVAFKLGIEGKIGAAVDFQYLTQTGQKDMNGTELSIDGSIGIKVEVKFLVVSYSDTFASTGFGWSKSYNDYDKIQDAWDGNGLTLHGVTESGRMYTMQLMSGDTALITIEGGGEIENRDYLDIYKRAWGEGLQLLEVRSKLDGAFTNVQSNAYPYSNPVFTDDGSMFLYISDNDNAKAPQTVVSYAVKSGDSYKNKGAVDTTEGAILSDSGVVASGTGNNVFAAWVKQMESPEKEMHDKATYDDLGMMMNATEIYTATYDGSDWTTERLTDNSVADMAPTIASSGNQAIVAWRSLAASELPEDGAAQDITASFNVENNINYRIWNGSAWSELQIAYNGSAGTVNAIDSAMLSDGTAILVYTVRTGEDATSTETFYTMIGKDGAVLTTGRLTNDSNADTNAQAVAVDDQFVVGWYTEYENGEDMHDVRLACINANGSVDADFTESIGGGAGNTISSSFRFSQPSGNNDLNNLSVVWAQTKNSDAEEDAGKYEINAVRFYDQGGGDPVSVTAQTKIAETGTHFTVDQLDAYTDDSGDIHALVLASDYNDIEGLTKYDTIDLSGLPVEADPSSDASADMLNILTQTPNTRIMLGSGYFPKNAIEAEPSFDIDELMPGLELPVQFAVRNTGTSEIDSVTVSLAGAPDQTFKNLSLLPGQSTLLTMTYEVPDGAVSDVNYTVTANDVNATGTLLLNRPDVGIAEMRLLSEGDGERDILVRLNNDSNIPLKDSGKTVKLAFYKDSDLTQQLTGDIAMTGDYSEIDEGRYTYNWTLNVRDIIGEGVEIPDEGITIYAKAWVEDVEETNASNNTADLSFRGLKAKYNASSNMDATILSGEEGVYTVKVDVRNNMMQGIKIGEILADVLDSDGNVLKEDVLVREDMSLGTEETKTVDIPLNELEGTPASVRLMAVVTFTATFAENGGVGQMAPITIREGQSTVLPENTFTREGYVFTGWKDQNGTTYKDGETVNLLGDVQLTAQWAEKVTVTFVPNSENDDVSGEMENAAMPKGVSAALPKNGFTRSGYVFAGWSTEPDGDVVYTDGQAVTLTEDTMLYAQWKTKSSGGGGGNPINVSAPGSVENGTVTVSSKSATQGKAITITVTPDEGYETSAVTVTDAKGNTVPVTKNDDGTYSFTMPATEVTVDAVFAKVEEQPPVDDGSCPKDATCPISKFTDAEPEAWYHDGVHWALEEDVMKGTSDTTFEPNGSATRAMVVTMLWRLEGEPAASGTSSFTDVTSGAWYEQAVNWAADNGVVKGTSETTFSPKASVTREQLAAILYRYAQSKGEGFTGALAFPLNFPDAASVSEYANEAMCWMTMKGIITGMGDGTLAPQDNATRAQIATMFMRFCGEMEQ